MRILVVVLGLVLGGCEIAEPECIVIPGPDVEPGLYNFESYRVWPEGTDATGLAYSDAEEMTIELSADRSLATIRYLKDGAEVEETWQIVISP